MSNGKGGANPPNPKELGVKLNRLAREQFKKKLLLDIMQDLTVCKLEGIDPKEYITELKNEIDRIYNKIK